MMEMKKIWVKTRMEAQNVSVSLQSWKPQLHLPVVTGVLIHHCTSLSLNLRIPTYTSPHRRNNTLRRFPHMTQRFTPKLVASDYSNPRVGLQLLSSSSVPLLLSDDAPRTHKRAFHLLQPASVGAVPYV